MYYQTPFSDVNILLLGQSGTGKSTFINAFANYLLSDSLREAMRKDMECLIPSSFEYTDPSTFQSRKIVVGNISDHEINREVGSSSTKICRSFTFPIDQRQIRLIDTPGVGDTEGYSTDQKNLEVILDFLSEIKYLNGICILLKSNEDRLNLMFRYSIKELLKYLHVNARNNLFFVFTNGRSTLYQLDRSAPLVRQLLSEINQKYGSDLKLTRQNGFVFDSESFRFLALHKNGIHLTEDQTDDYEKSWKKSIEEFHRMLKCILEWEQYSVSDSISLNEAEKMIRALSRPVAEITRLIEENLQYAKDFENQAKRPGASSTANNFRQIDVVVEELGHPRTVSTDKRFMKAVNMNGLSATEYTSHCHPHCSLIGVEQEVIGDPKLKDCAAMDPVTGICKQCRCHWKYHMHINYTIKKRLKSDSLAPVENDRALLRFVRKRIKDLELEKKIIIEVCAKLSDYLRKNSLSAFNDTIFEYLQQFIREEEVKKQQGASNDAVIHGLKQTLEDYQKLKDFVDDRNQNGAPGQSSGYVMQTSEIQKLVRSLYNLPLNGEKIRQQVELVEKSRKTSFQNQQSVFYKSKYASSSLKNDLSKILSPPQHIDTSNDSDTDNPYSF